MEPFTVFASTFASSCAGSSAFTEPLIVVAETPPVSPNASTRTRTSPLTDSAFTGPFAVTTSTSPLTVWTTNGPRAPATWTSPTIVVARPSQPDVTLPRAAAAVTDAAPHRADGNAALVGHGDEAHAGGVRGPV